MSHSNTDLYHIYISYSDFLFDKDAVNLPGVEIAARPMKYFKKHLCMLFHGARLSHFALVRLTSGNHARLPHGIRALASLHPIPRGEPSETLS